MKKYSQQNWMPKSSRLAKTSRQLNEEILPSLKPQRKGLGNILTTLAVAALMPLSNSSALKEYI